MMNDTTPIYIVRYENDEPLVVTSITYPRGFDSYPEVTLSPNLADAKAFPFKEACRHYARIPAEIKASYELWDEEDMYAEKVIQGEAPSVWLALTGIAALVGLVIALNVVK